jgi:iron complex transport system substrate-binding protein
MLALKWMEMGKHFCTLLLLLLTMPGPAAAAIALRDDLGQTLTLPAPAARVAVLGELAAELITALGANDLVIGRAHWLSWPPSLAAKPHLGLQSQPNLEILLSWRPDLILIDAHSRQVLPVLRELKLPVLVYQGRDLPDLRRAVEDLGQALQRPQRAAQLLAFIAQVEQTLQACSREAARPALLAFTEDGPPYYDMLAMRPLLARAGLSSRLPNSFSPEWLAAQSAELVILAVWHNGEDLRSQYQRLRQRPELSRVTQLKLLDSKLAFNLQALAGALYLAKWIHPQARFEPREFHRQLWRFFELPLNGAYVYPEDGQP